MGAGITLIGPLVCLLIASWALWQATEPTTEADEADLDHAEERAA